MGAESKCHHDSRSEPKAPVVLSLRAKIKRHAKQAQGDKRHVGDSQQAKRGGEGQAKTQQRRLPRVGRALNRLGKPIDQRRQCHADDKERQAHCQWTMAKQCGA